MIASVADNANCDALLKVDALCVNYGPVQALTEVRLAVYPGEAVALVGSNGAGKSTLFNAVMGLIRSRSGHIVLAGQDLARLSPQRRARLGLGYSPEGRRVFPGLSVRENLEVAARGSARERQRGVERAFGLFPDLKTYQQSDGWQLSGGQQQMLAIARALMTRPKLLLLDEPSLGLSPKIAEHVMGIVREIVADGTAVLLAEQNVTRSLACCDRAYVLELGKIALSGYANDLKDNDAVRKAYLGV